MQGEGETDDVVAPEADGEVSTEAVEDTAEDEKVE